MAKKPKTDGVIKGGVKQENWDDDLTPKQVRFIQEYLVDLNATQAALRAGYSADTAFQIGAENLKKPKIADALERAMDERAARTGINADRVLRELAKIGFSDLRKAVKWRGDLTNTADYEGGGDTLVVKTMTNNRVELVDSDALDDDTAAAISSISQNQAGGVTIKMHDKRAALVDIGKHLGLFRERMELSGVGGGSVQVELVKRVIVDPRNPDG
jgi:phage terminase small subunit